jgi:hypothetical protein
MFEQVVELGSKRGVSLRGAIFALEIQHERHQRFGDIAPAELAEMAAIVRLVAEGVEGCVHEFPFGLSLSKPCPFFESEA